MSSDKEAKEANADAGPPQSRSSRSPDRQPAQHRASSTPDRTADPANALVRSPSHDERDKKMTAESAKTHDWHLTKDKDYAGLTLDEDVELGGESYDRP